MNDLTSSNHITLASRIKAANNLTDIKRIETSLDRLYECGVFTSSEYTRIDNKIMDRIVELDL
jgi:hypothetical protein